MVQIISLPPGYTYMSYPVIVNHYILAANYLRRYDNSVRSLWKVNKLASLLLFQQYPFKFWEPFWRTYPRLKELAKLIFKTGQVFLELNSHIEFLFEKKTYYTSHGIVYFMVSVRRLKSYWQVQQHTGHLCESCVSWIWCISRNTPLYHVALVCDGEMSNKALWFFYTGRSYAIQKKILFQDNSDLYSCFTIKACKSKLIGTQHSEM